MPEKKFEKYARVLLYLVPFIPLLFVQGLFFPFIITRTLFFRLIIQLGIAIYLYLLINNFQFYKPRRHLIFLLVAIYFIISLIAGIFGYDFYKSFWSSFERMEGLVSLIYLAAYLFLLVIFLKTKKDWLFNIRAILFVSSLASFYGLIQRLNILPLVDSGANRISGTIGNAAFLAGFLILAIGLGAYYYFHEEDKRYRIFALAAMAIDFIVLLLTATRGAILGAVAGGLVYLTFNAALRRGKERKYSAIILAVLLVLALAFFLSRPSLANSKIELINRLATISLNNDATIKNRLIVWRMALKEFKLHPWLGVGMDNFDIVYNKYYTPDISESWFDRTHNIYLDQLMAGGIFGLAAYLSILFYLFYRLYKARQGDYYLFAVFSGMLIAYGIHNFFVFDTINTSFVYFFLIALISCGSRFFQDGAVNKITPPLKNAGEGKFMAQLAMVLLVITNLYVFYKLIYLPLKINQSLYTGYYYAVADPAKSYNGFATALNYKFGSNESADQLGQMFDVLDSDQTANRADVEKLYNLAVEKFEFAAANYPLDIRPKLYLGQLVINNYKSQNELDLAEKELKAAISLSPSRTEPYYLLFNLYLKENDKNKAVAVLETLDKQVPWYVEAKIMLAGALSAIDRKKADQYFNQAISQLKHPSEDELKKILEYLLNGQKYKNAIPYYLRLIAIAPDKYAYRVDLSKVYYLTGNIDAAVEQINIINEKSPNTLNGFEQYLNLLNQAYHKTIKQK